MPASPNAGESVWFVGGGSYDPEAEEGNGIELYEWTFGDGKRGTGESISHAYVNGGSYNVTLSITATTGGVAEATQAILVGAAVDNPPVAEFAFTPTSPEVGDSVTFSAEASADAADASARAIVSYAWDFGDSSTGAGVTATHAYTNAGAFVVTLTVSDDKGSNDSAQRMVVVSSAASGNEIPVAAFVYDPSAPYKTQTITFSASSSYDPASLSARSIALYSWDFGDANVGVGKTVTHSYADAGVYTVVLSVVDDDGAMGTASAAVTVTDYVIPPPPPPPG